MHEPLPSGTVTFAFTDIEGSTQRWERNRLAMDRALQRHDAILRETIGAHGGGVFKTVGDAFCAAFGRPADAIAAMIAAQRALAAEDFSDVDGLRIRAALHSGTAEERDGDYFGPSVNRVARLLGIAYGGQVLVSGATRELVASALPAESALLDLGRHRLKDLIEPEHVYQLVAPGLADTFPALRSLESLRHNLPQQMTPLVGREDEVAEIGALLATSRLVTVVGPGGIGKTRTTLQVGADLLDGTGDGVWFVELAPLASADFFPAAIAQAMALHLGSDADPVEALVRALKPKRALLVVDNCEHLIDGVSRAVGALLRGCPDLSILASSRQALGIAGEATFRMPSLAEPAAVALFVERAAAADSRFTIEGADPAAIAAICRRLDGIPLAIELAAARVKILRPRQLLERLDERFRVLTGGRRDALPRQQTLAALIDWSHDLLDERERALFRRLGVFANTFTLEGAIAIGAIDGLDDLDVIDLLQSLADKSLVATEPHDDALRYRLLESTRAYARDKLRAAGEDARAADLHAAFVAGLAANAYREFDTTISPGWLRRYAAEIDDVRGALTWTLDGAGDARTGATIAADAGPVFLRMELLNEGLRWCEAARGLDDLPASTRGRIEYVASMMHNNLGESRRGLACAERAVAFFEGSGDERGLVRALSQVAQLYTRSGRVEDARAPAELALQRARSLGEPRVLSAVLRRCASSLPSEEIEQARALFAEGLAVAQSIGDPEETGLVLQWWAGREANAGLYARAIDLASEARSIDDGDGTIFLELQIASWCFILDRPNEAAMHARRALDLSSRIENPLTRAYAIALCAPQYARHDPAEAAALFGYALALLRATDWVEDEQDRLTFAGVERRIADRLTPATFAESMRLGESWSETRAVAALAQFVSSAAEC